MATEEIKLAVKLYLDSGVLPEDPDMRLEVVIRAAKVLWALEVLSGGSGYDVVVMAAEDAPGILPAREEEEDFRLRGKVALPETMEAASTPIVKVDFPGHGANLQRIVPGIEELRKSDDGMDELKKIARF